MLSNASDLLEVSTKPSELREVSAQEISSLSHRGEHGKHGYLKQIFEAVEAERITGPKRPMGKTSTFKR